MNLNQPLGCEIFGNFLDAYFILTASSNMLIVHFSVTDINRPIIVISFATITRDIARLCGIALSGRTRPKVVQKSKKR